MKGSMAFNRTNTYWQLNMSKVIKEKKSEEPDDDDDTNCEHDIYNKLDKTQDFIVADGIVSFTCTFRYLGSLISYNRWWHQSPYCSRKRIYMGALKEIWINPNLNTYNKYLVFRAIPMNLLLWGWELTWQARSLLTQKHCLMNIRPKTMAQQSWNMWNDRAQPRSITTHPWPRIGCIQNRSKNKVQTTISDISFRITKLSQDTQPRKHQNSLNYSTMQTNTSKKDFNGIAIGIGNWKLKLFNYLFYYPFYISTPSWSTHASPASTRTSHSWFHNDKLAQKSWVIAKILHTLSLHDIV